MHDRRSLSFRVCGKSGMAGAHRERKRNMPYLLFFDGVCSDRTSSVIAQLAALFMEQPAGVAQPLCCTMSWPTSASAGDGERRQNMTDGGVTPREGSFVAESKARVITVAPANST
jgi:hypothetical protein